MKLITKRKLFLALAWLLVVFAGAESYEIGRLRKRPCPPTNMHSTVRITCISFTDVNGGESPCVPPGAMGYQIYMESIGPAVSYQINGDECKLPNCVTAYIEP